MSTDTSREPDADGQSDDEDEDGGHRFPFDPAKDDKTPLGDTDQHSDADA